MLYSQLHLQQTVAQAATAVYHEVNITLPQDDVPEQEPVEDPPTYVTATGRIVASELVWVCGCWLLHAVDGRNCCLLPGPFQRVNEHMCTIV
jgi:hypothetical protein